MVEPSPKRRTPLLARIGKRIASLLGARDPTVDQLQDLSRCLQQKVEMLEADLAKMQAENTELRKALEDRDRQLKSSNRRRFSRGTRKENPKKPGRKGGHPPAQRAKPDVIDQVVEVPLAGCVDCGGPLVNVETLDFYQTDIPQPVKAKTTQFRCASGWCVHCQKQSTARAAGQMATPNGAIQTGLGPNVIALMAVLKDRLGVSFGNIAKLLDQFFGLRVSRGGISQALDRLAERLQGEYLCLIHEIRGSGVVHVDETGWAISGDTAWLWVFTTQKCTVFTIRRGRGRDVPLDVLGEDFDGRVVSDLLAAYRNLPYKTAKCVGHLVRDLADLVETKKGSAFCFLVKLLAAFRVALILGKVNPGCPDRTYEAMVQRLTRNIKKLARAGRGMADPDCKRLSERLLKYGHEYLVFLSDPSVPPTNNQAERKLRPAVLARRMWVGNQSPRGALRHATLASIIETCAAKGIDFAALAVKAMLGLMPPAGGWLGACEPATDTS